MSASIEPESFTRIAGPAPTNDRAADEQSLIDLIIEARAVAGAGRSVSPDDRIWSLLEELAQKAIELRATRPYFREANKILEEETRWRMFGSHQDGPVRLEFRGEDPETLEPLYERSVADEVREPTHRPQES